MAMRRAVASAASAASRAVARYYGRARGARSRSSGPSFTGVAAGKPSTTTAVLLPARGRNRQHRSRRVGSTVVVVEQPSSAIPHPPPRDRWTMSSSSTTSLGPSSSSRRADVHVRHLSTRTSDDSTSSSSAASKDEDEPASSSTASTAEDDVPGGRESGGSETTSSSSPGDGEEGSSSSSSYTGDERDGTGKDKDDDGTTTTNTTGSGFSNFKIPDSRDVIDTILTSYTTFKTELASTWRELLDSGSPRDVNKVIHPPTTQRPDEGDHSGERENVDDEAADRYVGTSAVMVVDEKLGAWEKMQRRLAEAPIIKGILGASHEIFEKTGAAQAKRRIDDIREDAAEAWETSQNPWVYRLSSVWDTVTAESEFALATRELQRLDPGFTLEGFRADVMGHTIPQIMGWFLEGKTKELKPWLGEAVYNRLAAEIRVRKQEGLIVDPHILGMENSEILAAEIDELNKGSPIILLHFMCQQINCVRKKDGTVVEGGEDEIRANSYIVALQREYDEVDGALRWKIVDFRFNGGIPWV